MASNPEITRTCNERRRLRDRIIGLSLSIESARANFSPGDDWTPADDRVAFQIEQLHKLIDETADQLTRAAMAHRLAIDALETKREADRLTED